MKLVSTFLNVLACTGLAMAGDWPQGAGPNGNLSSANEMPVEWSVALDERIHWKITLPETGQNTPTVFGNKVFFHLQTIRSRRHHRQKHHRLML